MARRSVRTFWMIAACLLGPVCLALAQAPPLPAALVQAANLAPDQIKQIQQFAEDVLKNLSSDDGELRKQARNALIDPLKGRGVSVSFRQAYSAALMTKLAQLARDFRDGVATNALRVVGELATSEAVELLGERLSDKSSVSVRLFAAMECARVYDMLNPANEFQPAARPPELQTLADKLGDRLVNETHSNVLDTVVRALMSGASVSREGFDAVRKKAFAVLCTQSVARAKALAGWPQALDAMPALLRGQDFLRDALGQPNPRLALTPEEARQVLSVQGQLIFWIADHLKEIGEATPRQLPDQVLRVAETACVVGFEKLGEQLQPQKLADDFKKGTPEGDRDFFRKALELRRRFTTPPLNLGPFGKP